MEKEVRETIEELKAQIKKLEVELEAEKALHKSEKDLSKSMYEMWMGKCKECDERKETAETMIKLFNKMVKSWK